MDPSSNHHGRFPYSCGLSCVDTDNEVHYWHQTFEIRFNHRPDSSSRVVYANILLLSQTGKPWDASAVKIEVKYLLWQHFFTYASFRQWPVRVGEMLSMVSGNESEHFRRKSGEESYNHSVSRHTQGGITELGSELYTALVGIRRTCYLCVMKLYDGFLWYLFKYRGTLATTSLPFNFSYWPSLVTRGVPSIRTDNMAFVTITVSPLYNWHPGVSENRETR